MFVGEGDNFITCSIYPEKNTGPIDKSKYKLLFQDRTYGYQFTKTNRGLGRTNGYFSVGAGE